MAFVLNRPACSVRQATTQNLTSASLTAITFDVNDNDPWSMHSTSVNNTRITPPVSGRYRLTGGVGYAVNATGGRQAMFRLNGSAILTPSQAAVGNAGGSFNSSPPAITVEQVFNGTSDYVELLADQNSGGTLATVAGSSVTIRWESMS